jgi:MFS family permease
MLPLVVTMIVTGPFVERIVDRLGSVAATTSGAVAVLAGLVGYGVLGRYGYVFIAVALVLISAGMRVVGVTATVSVMDGLPEDRTSIGAALTDTATEVSNAIGIAVSGTLIAALFAGDIAAPAWSQAQVRDFEDAVMVAMLALAAAAAALVVWASVRSSSRRARA